MRRDNHIKNSDILIFSWAQQNCDDTRLPKMLLSKRKTGPATPKTSESVRWLSVANNGHPHEEIRSSRATIIRGRRQSKNCLRQFAGDYFFPVPLTLRTSYYLSLAGYNLHNSPWICLSRLQFSKLCAVIGDTRMARQERFGLDSTWL